KGMFGEPLEELMSLLSTPCTVEVEDQAKAELDFAREFATDWLMKKLSS
ncbi:hypothetical protein LCGC14_3034970, partial [marine sediment metagenome]